MSTRPVHMYSFLLFSSHPSQLLSTREVLVSAKTHAQAEFNNALPRPSPLVSLPPWRLIRILDGVLHSLHPTPCHLRLYYRLPLRTLPPRTSGKYIYRWAKSAHLCLAHNVTRCTATPEARDHRFSIKWVSFLEGEISLLPPTRHPKCYGPCQRANLAEATRDTDSL